MTCQSDGLARVRARVTQGFVQGFSRSFLRLCKGCKGSGHPCLTYMCARARLRTRVGLHKTLATLATLAHSKPISFFYSRLAVRDCARVTQGLGVPCKGSALARGFALRSSSRVRGASGTDGRTSGGRGATGAAVGTPPGGVDSGGGVAALDRYRPHVGIFSHRGGFSGFGVAKIAPLSPVGRVGATKAALALPRSPRRSQTPCRPCANAIVGGVRSADRLPINFPGGEFGL